MLDQDVSEQEVVGEVLLELDELLALAECHRWPRSRKRVGENVVLVDAVPAVHLDVLVDESRRERGALVGREPDGRPEAAAESVVDVVVHRKIGAHGIDEPRDAIVVRRDTEGCPLAKGQVDAKLRVSARAAAIDETEPEFGEDVANTELRLVGNVSNGSAQRTGPEQRSLRPPQHFDPVRIKQIDVGREQRQRDHRLVEKHADLLFHPRLIAYDLPGRYAAHRDLALARSEVLHGQPGDVRCNTLEVLHAAKPQHFLRRCGDREWDIEYRLLPLGCGHRSLPRPAPCAQSRRALSKRRRSPR